MADRTGAFLAQLTAFLEGKFTGDIVLQCQHGRILEMQVKQRIQPTENGSDRSTVLFPNSSGLTAVAGRP